MKKTLALIALILATTPALADPNASELKSFYNLIPDYVGVNSATSAAISPDGNTVAFFAAQPGLWILPDVNRFRALKEGKGYPQAKPWRIETPLIKPQPSVIVDLSNSANEDRIDWSADGKRVALIWQGRLWLAEGIDVAKRTARLRLLAGPLTKAQLKPPHDKHGQAQSGLANPKWSPDGTRIAFVRPHVGQPNTLCVINVRSGKETRLATDSGPGLSARPWSPDGKFLVYSKANPDNDSVVGTRIVPADGGTAKDLSSGEDKMLANASWLNDERLIASGWVFSADPSTTSYFDTAMGTGTILVEVSARDGSFSQVSRIDPLAVKRIELARAEADKHMRQCIEDEYHSEMTPDQITRLRDGSMGMGEILFVMCKREFRRAARQHGGKMQKVVEQALNTNPTTMEAFSDAIGSATEGLPPEETKGWKFSVNLGPQDNVLLGPIRDYGQCPSPDGTRVAFFRRHMNQDEEQLWLLDLSTGKESLLMSSGELGSINWTADGKRLIVQSNRTLALKREIKPAKNGKLSLTWPSYGEVWLLEPKP